MTELSRNLLAAAREGLDPDPAVAARVRARVAATVGVSATVAPVKASATASTAALKVAGSLALLGIVAVALVALPRKTEHPPLAPQVTANSVDTDVPPTVVHVARTEPSVAAAAPVAAPPPAPLATLAREVELIDRAMLALKAGAAPAALDAIAMFDRETQHHGQMAEDAAAIAIEAHCQLEHDVRARLAAFERAYPSSAQRARLDAACR